MQFNRLSIENVGNFFGLHEFDLRPTSSIGERKPIILFGGLNGAGKTTIFESIKLCLYGPEMLGAVGVARYHEYLRQKIHQSKSTALRPSHAAIELEFEYVSFGKINTYLIERAWQWTGSKIKETLQIRKNGESVDDVERDSWQDFIKEMIPLGLSQLFFFDGEKIRRMMADEKNEELKGSIFALLGLDLVERLQTDLKIYRSKNLKELSHSNLGSDLSEMEGTIAQLEETINTLKSDKNIIESGIVDIQLKISRYKAKMSAQGEGYYKNRAELEERKRTLEKAIETLQEKIRELAGGLLPVAIAGKTGKLLEKQINQEQAQRVDALVSATLAEKWQTIMSHVCSDQFLSTLGVEQVTARKVSTEIVRQVEELLITPNAAVAGDEIFGFSERQTLDILALIRKAQTEVPQKLTVVTAELEKNFREMEKVATILNKAPDDIFIQPMYETLEKLITELNEQLARKLALDEELSNLSRAKLEFERRKDALSKKIEESVGLNDKLSNVSKVQKVLDRYHVELSRLKIARLQEEFERIFKELHRKEDMIARVAIDPQSCEVTLFDGHDQSINKGSLSSGELEIYAISMLWSLARTSGQKLPFIIDTPLARLDSEHRDNLINQFFPHASHQVMIFSTNTEVDRQYFDQLKPNLAKAFSLEYDQTAKMTIKKEGYFWT